MFLLSFSIMKKLLITSVLILFIFISVFGLSLTMQVHEDGSMANCPFMMEQSSMCKMPVGDHIAWWQQVFTAIPELSSFLLLILIFFVGLTFLIFQFTLAPPITRTLETYQRNNPDIRLFNGLSVAFSEGILHPKIYN